MSYVSYSVVVHVHVLIFVDVDSDVNGNTCSDSRRQSSYHCCVPLCNGDSRYDKTLKFHRIPGRQKDSQLRKDWLVKIRRDEGPHFKVPYYKLNLYLC